MPLTWKRKSWTTKSSDPTEVVEWSCEKYRITEFQGIYGVEVKTPSGTWEDEPRFNDIFQELHVQFESQETELHEW